MAQPMILLLTDMITEARTLLAEITASASFYTDADLTYFANQALYDACVFGLVFEKLGSLSLTTGVDYVAAPDDWVKTKDVFDHNGNALRPIHPADQGRYYALPVGADVVSLYWYDWGVNIYLKPTPVFLLTRTHAFYYYALDVALTGSNAPNIPSKYHRALIPFMCYRALMKARQFQDAAAFAQEYARMTNTNVDRLIMKFPMAYAVSGVVPIITSGGATPVTQVPQIVPKP